jgi:hypothetical protein
MKTHNADNERIKRRYIRVAVHATLARRPQPQATPLSDGAGVATTTSAAGLVLAFILRYGMQRLPSVLQQIWRRGSQSNRRTRLCRPILKSIRHVAQPPG